ncbi:serine hydrolase [Jeongeupia sp. USM3]|uniref:serine hydrolase domain-containing protein n=1 Tax=Jeongeupia sp. USM3 TaxID=1906741 RepID=UPI00089DDAE7|nr:serine hydrolase [Jeongeupia sp. USM3]AOY00337.1 hypothetical protein BJP62_07690 [Jeongeupia sp. USM3]
MSAAPIVAAALMLVGCHRPDTQAWPILLHAEARLSDRDVFAAQRVDAAPQSLPWPRSPKPLVWPGLPEAQAGEAPEAWLARQSTVAFLVIKDGRLRYEHYSGGYAAGDPIPSFSVAKSVVSALVGVGLQAGWLQSVDQPVTHWLPELAQRDPRFSRLTLRELLAMRSGLAWDEAVGNIASDVAWYYLAADLRGWFDSLDFAGEPGDAFRYQSVNTQLIAAALERASGQSIATLLQRWLWQPLGAEYPASWSVDALGTVKAFCCLNAGARDLARIGELYLAQGRWRGRQIIPSSWVAESTTAIAGGEYGLHWWTPPKSEPRRGDYYAQGLSGQYLYIYPARRTVIVRLGERNGEWWPALMRAIAEAN